MVIHQQAIAWNNTNIDYITKKTLKEFKLWCIFSFCFSGLVFLFGLAWVSLSIYSDVNVKPNQSDYQIYWDWCKYLLIMTFGFNIPSVVFNLMMFIKSHKIPHQAVKKLYFDLTLCGFVWQTFSLFLGVVYDVLIYQKSQYILNYPVVFDNQQLKVQNLNHATIKNDLKSSLKYTFVSNNELDYQIKALVFKPKQKTIQIQIFSLINYLKLDVNLPNLYQTQFLIETKNLVPIVHHVYLDPKQRIVKIQYLAYQNTCFENHENFMEQVIVLPQI